MYDEAIDVVNAEEVLTPRDSDMASEEHGNNLSDENFEDSTRKVSVFSYLHTSFSP